MTMHLIYISLVLGMTALVTTPGKISSPISGSASEVAEKKASEEVMPTSAAAFVEMLQAKAEQGDADAQFKLGRIYDSIYGKSARVGLDEIVPDDAKAVMWLRKAADQGHASAQFYLGQQYQHGEGRGVAKDYVQAVELYKRAANQGDSDAQGSLGWMYAEGIGVAKNDSLAASWYRRAAAQGNSAGQLLLAVMYSYGRGVPKDRVQSYAWASLAGPIGIELKTALSKRMSGRQIAEAQKASSLFLAKLEIPATKERYVFKPRSATYAQRAETAPLHGTAVEISASDRRMAAIKKGVTKNFKDDESARFRGVRLFVDDAARVSYVCGFVNGKNSYGAYAGYQPFFGSIFPDGAGYHFVNLGAFSDIADPSGGLTLQECKKHGLDLQR